MGSILAVDDSTYDEKPIKIMVKITTDGTLGDVIQRIATGECGEDIDIFEIKKKFSELIITSASNQRIGYLYSEDVEYSVDYIKKNSKFNAFEVITEFGRQLMQEVEENEPGFYTDEQDLPG